MQPNLLNTPFWWDEAPPTSSGEPGLPNRCDVLIVGGGYTGLSAGLELCRRGRDVVVLDAHAPGYGASSRSGGMLGDVLKPGFGNLAKRYGEAKAVELWNEAARALAFTKARLEGPGYDCDFAVSGRFTGAMRPEHYERMGRELDRLGRHFEIDADMIPREHQQSEVATQIFFGGRLLRHHACVHPAKYHRDLLAELRRAGGRVFGNCAAHGLQREGAGWQVATARGTLVAQKVLLATNGYTDALSVRHQRFVIPVDSHIVATEPLDPALVRELFPNSRMVTDTLKVASFFRPSPDGKRVLFGGRAGDASRDLSAAADTLRRRMVRIFPRLEETNLTHVWSGRVAFSYAPTPQIGGREGVYHALCYSGSGVAMSSWLGHKVAQKICGEQDGATAFDDIVSPAPRFTPAKQFGVRLAIRAFNIGDRLGLIRHGAG